MDKAEVISEIEGLLRGILDEDELSLTAESTADSVEDWDSLAQIKLVLAIETSMAVTFDAAEVANFSNVGELADRVLAKQHALAS